MRHVWIAEVNYLSDAAYARSSGLGKGMYADDIRIDQTPCWNRDNTAMLVPEIASDKTRQMFIVRIMP